MQKALGTLILLILFKTAYSQIYSVEILRDSGNVSFRGLSIVNDDVVWVSGNNGTTGRSVDGGKTWQFMQIQNYESAEFRDIEGFDENTAIVMSSYEPACILKTTDGGVNWKEVFRGAGPEIFLDALDFHGSIGICLGDPVGHQFFLISTSDGGDSWAPHQSHGYEMPSDSLAAFAASGSVIRLLNDTALVFATGGNAGFLFCSDQPSLPWNMISTPMVCGGPSKGIFSFDMLGKKNIVIAGGDYLMPDESAHSLFSTNNFGKTWTDLSSSSTGYISCVKYLSHRIALTCGMNGINRIDMKKNTGNHISDVSFHVIGISPSGKTIILAGANGKIGKLILH